MKKSIIILFCLLAFFNLKSNVCKSITKEEQYLLSDKIIVGKVSEIYSNFFNVSVLERFKGPKEDEIVISLKKNSIVPLKGEIWLFYISIEEGKNYIDACSWSRSFQYPISVQSKDIPKPVKQNVNEDDWSSIKNQYLQKATMDLYYDIALLRQKNMSDKIDSMYFPYISFKNNSLFLICLLIINLIGVLVFIYRK